MNRMHLLLFSGLLLGFTSCNAAPVSDADAQKNEPETVTSQDSGAPQVSTETETDDRRQIATLTIPGFGITVPILTSRDQLDQHAGQVVAIRGSIPPRTKQAHIIGVEVSGGQGMKDACAVGILAKFVTTEEDWNNNPPPGGQGSWGIGTKYRLYEGLDGQGARPVPWGSGFTENRDNISGPE